MFFENDQLTSTAHSQLLLAMKLTASKKASPEQFVIALLHEENSALSRVFARTRPGFDREGLRTTLVASAADSRATAITTSEWSDDFICSRSRAALDKLASLLEPATGDSQRQESLLAAEMLQAMLPRVQRVIQRMGIDLEQAVTLLKEHRPATERPQVFDEAGNFNHDAFSKTGTAVLRLIESEARGLGLQRVGTPLLLFALIARPDGLLEQALHLQALDPRQLHKNLLLQLRALGKKRFNDEFVLTREIMQPVVVQAFENAATKAFDLGLDAIGEAELVNALLRSSDFFVQNFFTSAEVDFERLRTFLATRHSGEEVEGPDEQLLSLDEMDARLRRNVVGQDHVIDLIMPIIKRLRFNYPRPNRPLSVLLFLGNSGTGKTQLAKEIARAIYGSEDQLIFIEMGQFGTEHSKSMFVGAPPGYVGYGEGLLTNGLRDKPGSVVLFDEVEKAHQSVFDVLLRFLDEGQIADPAGPVRDGRSCVVILTSNHALDKLQPLIDRQTQAGKVSAAQLETARQEIRNAILETKFFRPEFLNRVDDLVLFNRLDGKAYRKILTHQLVNEQNRLRELKDLDVEFDESLIDSLCRQCEERSGEGARVCAKLISTLVLTPLIDYFLEDENQHVRRLRVGMSAQGDLEYAQLAATGRSSRG